MKLYHCRFCTYFRMSLAQFEFLLAELGPHLRRRRNNFRVLINLKRRLAACWCQNRIILLFILLVISLYIQYLGVVLAMSTPDWSDRSVLFIHMGKSEKSNLIQKNKCRKFAIETKSFFKSHGSPWGFLSQPELVI